MYRMKLGNPTSTGSNQPVQRRPSSSASASAKSRLSTEAGRGTRVPALASDIDGRVNGVQGISELLDKLNLGHSTQKEEGLDPNAAIGFCKYLLFLPQPELSMILQYFNVIPRLSYSGIVKL